MVPEPRARERACGLPLVRLLPIQSVVCRRGHGCWVHRGSRVRACFHALAPIGSSTVPEVYGYSSVHPLIRRAPLQSSFDLTPASPFRVWRLPTWVSALFSTSPRIVHCGWGLPGPHAVPSSGALNLSTACSAARLASLFHPAAESRTLARSGDCPLRAAPPLSSNGACPLAVGADELTRKRAATPRRLDFEAFLHTKPRVRSSVVSLAPDRAPLRVWLLLQVSQPPATSVPRRRTLMTFQRSLLLSPACQRESIGAPAPTAPFQRRD